MNSNGLLEAALGYAELGYRVFPCAPGGKKPLTANGFKDATTDPAQLEAWWSKWPNANIGMATEGLVVIDEDRPGNPWLKDAPEQQADLAGAPMSVTPRGGNHRIMRQPNGKLWRCSTGKIAPKVDVRADGGYIVLPPSVRRKGVYRWQETMELDCPPAELPEPPGWLMDLLDDVGTRDDTARTVASGTHIANTIPSGQRNATLARLGGTMRRVGMSEAEILAALLTANDERCEPPLPRREVEQVASSIARYEPDSIATAVVEDHYEQQFGGQPKDTPTSFPDPGPIPKELLRIPGFISEVMDHCLATAPYPNTVMAFCGALALQSFLAGRKVRDPGDNRTNIYLLGLAHSGVGKNWPREINVRVIHQAGLMDGLGQSFASGEGIQDALFVTPCMLFQTDEIDGMLQSMTKSRDARHEAVMSTLLTMYSSANSVFPMRRKAGKESPGVIDQPSLTIFGTAIPTHYYRALSERMLTNGFLARMLIFEAGERGNGQDPAIADPPARIIAVARWWADYAPGQKGNLKEWHPVPAVVEHSDGARRVLTEARDALDHEYREAQKRHDSVATTVLARVDETARKLALLYAASENHEAPRISKAAAEWATHVAMHQARRMLFMASENVADSEFDAERLKLRRIIRESGGEIAHQNLLHSSHLLSKQFKDIIETMIESGEVVRHQEPTRGRPATIYKLL